ncbi:MAG TPA: tetratricopeptide repeat protein, partial [Anaerolineales bacterium]|nr:tetratricopeptide repeat protein [Anaerolineales bacterium]
YSQGAREESEISADLFIAAALAWFGDPDPTRGSPWDKGGRLAELIKQQRTLLILDGLEPLQNSTPVEIGKIKDLGLRSLLRELARQNPGLVIITTRLTVDDLKDFIGDSAIEINLDNLSPEAGVLYLEHLGVKGLPNELTKATHEFGGHALALTILGHYLVDVHDADIRKRDLIPNLTVEEEKGGHAKRIMEAYEKWFEEQPESEILYLMGLFDRPAEKGAIDALLAEPVIDGLTNELQALPTENYRLALKHLRRARLLAQQDPHEPNVLDCHPLLREHFGEKLKAVNPIAWRDAHSRLYEYYKSSAKEFPDTIEEMVVLYAAVTHGCLAGRYQEALDVYWERILRGEKHFSWKKLGSHGADLAALNGFFDSAWHRITEVLSEDDKLFIMGQVGLYLRALGRLMEAVSPMQSSMDLAILENDWLNAAVQANNLSELHLFIGNTTQAVSYASRCIEFADNSGNPLWQVISRSTHANVLHQRGLFVEAEIAFTEAEERQKKGRHPILCYLRGFQYCDLLISQRKYQEVIRRATQTLNWTIQEYTEGSVGPLEIALDNLSLGRAHLRSTQLKSDDLFIESGNYLNNAVDGLRQAGEQIYIPRGLLARAEFYRLTGAHDKAQKDLDEVFTITSHGGTKLYLADYHLEYARLYLANGDKANALEQWKIAKDMIEKTGYHRRDNEVEEFEEQLK